MDEKIEKTVLEEMRVISRGFAYHVDGCPIQSRTFKGIPYANVIDDCWCCQFHEGHDLDIEKPYVMCSGRSVWLYEF